MGPDKAICYNHPDPRTADIEVVIKGKHESIQRVKRWALQATLDPRDVCLSGIHPLGECCLGKATVFSTLTDERAECSRGIVGICRRLPL